MKTIIVSKTTKGYLEYCKKNNLSPNETFMVNTKEKAQEMQDNLWKAMYILPVKVLEID